MEQDLTQGSISKVLLRFVLPFLGASILQFLYSVVDMIIVGQFADAAAISAVNTSGQIMQLITGLISGIATGGTVLIGQHVGAKRYPSVSSVAQALLALCLGLGVLLTAVFLAGNHFIISIMQVPAAAVLPAQDYLRITSLGILFIAGYNGISAILRGLGDSKRPMYFVGCSCILNIFGDLLLVGGFRMGAAGAALATMLSQAVACILALLFLLRGTLPFPFSCNPRKAQPAIMGQVLRLGIPLAAQDVLVNLSFVMITAIVNHMGLTQSAAVGVVERIIGFGMLIPIAFLSALSAFTAQNVGACELERTKSGLKLSILLCLIVTGVFTGVIECFPGAVSRLFTSDRAVVSNCILYLRTYSLDILMVSFVFCFNGFFSGYGKTTFTMLNCVLSTFLVRVPLVYLFSIIPNTSLLLIGIAAPTASLVQIIMQLVYYRAGSWKRIEQVS